MAYTRGSRDVHVTGRRIVATIIDGILFGIVSGVLRAFFGTGTSTSGFRVTQLSTRGNLALLAAAALYYILLEGLVGRTVGKMVTGIKVIDADTGNPPGIVSAAVRTASRVIDGLGGYLVGFIIVLVSDRRRRLGDIAAKTLVVRA